MEALGLSRGFRKLVGAVEGCLLLFGAVRVLRGSFGQSRFGKGRVRSLYD